MSDWPPPCAHWHFAKPPCQSRQSTPPGRCAVPPELARLTCCPCLHRSASASHGRDHCLSLFSPLAALHLVSTQSFSAGTLLLSGASGIPGGMAQRPDSQDACQDARRAPHQVDEVLFTRWLGSRCMLNCDMTSAVPPPCPLGLGLTD